MLIFSGNFLVSQNIFSKGSTSSERLRKNGFSLHVKNIESPCSSKTDKGKREREIENFFFIFFCFLPFSFCILIFSRRAKATWMPSSLPCWIPFSSIYRLSHTRSPFLIWWILLWFDWRKSPKTPQKSIGGLRIAFRLIFLLFSSF